jgi:hypothetical protein
MNRKNEKGFALILSLVLLLVMSLMGGSLIVISAGDHQSNNTSDDFQQTFYVAETALLEGEKYLTNHYKGPYTKDAIRDSTKAGLPDNKLKSWKGKMEKKNYTASAFSEDICFRSFPTLDRDKLFKDGIVDAESWNFGILIRTSFIKTADDQERKEAEGLKKYFYEYFIERIGDAAYRGYGSSVKKKQQDTGKDGMAYRVYGCGINSAAERMVIALESTVVLPKK